MGLTFSQCVGVETTIGGWLGVWFGVGSGATHFGSASSCAAAPSIGVAGAFLVGFGFGDSLQACLYCSELVCP